MVLAAQLFLQALANGVEAGIRTADVGAKKNAVGMLHLTGAHVHYAHQLPLAGRFQYIPQPFDIDEKGFLVFLGRFFATEIGAQVDCPVQWKF